MKKSIAIILFFFVSSCLFAQKTKQKSIVGTWRLLEFTNLDSATYIWIYPFGKNPKGYFTYTESGVVSINISNNEPLKISEEEGKKYSVNLYDFITTNSFGYFGTYTLEPDKGMVIHHVRGGTIP